MTMLITTAVDLVDNLIYKPGWRFTATDHTRRFEGSIKLRIDYPARASERDEAPGYDREINTYAEFPIIVRDCADVDLYRRIIECIMEIEQHEAREFLRVKPTMWAPFHPHNIEGMRRWGTTLEDLKFGIV